MPRTRTYKSDRHLSPLPDPVVAIEGGDLPAWEDGALLHDIKSAASILTQKLGSGYSERMIRQRIKNGQWIQNKEWYMTGSRYKISIARVVEWQTRGNAEYTTL